MHIKYLKNFLFYLYAARDVKNDIITTTKLTSGNKIEKKSVKNHTGCYNGGLASSYNLQTRPTTALTRSSYSSLNEDPS